MIALTDRAENGFHLTELPAHDAPEDQSLHCVESCDFIVTSVTQMHRRRLSLDKDDCAAGHNDDDDGNVDAGEDGCATDGDEVAKMLSDPLHNALERIEDCASGTIAQHMLQEVQELGARRAKSGNPQDISDT